MSSNKIRKHMLYRSKVNNRSTYVQLLQPVKYCDWIQEPQKQQTGWVQMSLGHLKQSMFLCPDQKWMKLVRTTVQLV